MPSTLHASDASADEMKQVSDLVHNLPQGSPLGVLLQHLVVCIDKGQDVAYLSMEQQLSPNEASEMLGMSRPHLLKFIRSGELKTAPDVGTHQRIPMSELMDFVDRRERAKAVLASAYGTSDIVEKALRDGAGTLTDEDVAALDAL